ncbi:MAG: hypothetical protein QOJ99_1897, partial [Bryobacterales bacterium]|nr:hypothetical protein [Bryobacterales bacterium]
MTEIYQNAPAFLHERELLLNCAACDGDEAVRAQFGRLAARSLDWHWVLTTAESQGVLPLLRARLEEVCPAAPPVSVRNQLSLACVANAAHNLRMTGELLAVLQALEADGIESVPFKGPALANQLFGNVAMRQFRDLDILVRPADVDRARAVLLARGYRPEFELTPKREAEYLRSEHAFQFKRQDGAFIVELHWSFGSRDQAFPLSAQSVWSRLGQAKFQSRIVHALSSEDLLIYLAMHGAKHRWDRLEWICSLAQLIRVKPDLDWSVVFSRAQRTGALRGVRLALLLARDICAAPLPPLVEEQTVVDPAVREMSSEVRENLFATDHSYQSSELRRQAFYIRTRERMADRARIVLFYWV